MVTVIGDEPLASRLTTGLTKIALALRTQAWESAGREGLHPTQAQILLLLAGHPAGLRIGELAAQLGVTAATTSDSVRALEGKGSATKLPVAGDARGVRVKLTEEGHEQARRQAGWPDALVDVIGELDPQEQQVLLHGVIKMIRGLQERGLITVARMCVTCRYFAPYAHNDPERPHHCRFVDIPFGDQEFRVDCPDHAPTTLLVLGHNEHHDERTSQYRA